MEYMVFLSYLIFIAQVIMNRPITKKENEGSYTCKGYRFYKIRGIINVTVGLAGMIAVNLFLPDHNVISQTFVWVALIGFMLLMLYGTYCLYKMIVSTEP